MIQVSLPIVWAHTVSRSRIWFLIYFHFPQMTPAGEKHHSLPMHSFKAQIMTGLSARCSQLNESSLPNTQLGMAVVVMSPAPFHPSCQRWGSSERPHHWHFFIRTFHTPLIHLQNIIFFPRWNQTWKARFGHTNHSTWEAQSFSSAVPRCWPMSLEFPGEELDYNWPQWDLAPDLHPSGMMTLAEIALDR